LESAGFDFLDTVLWPLVLFVLVRWQDCSDEGPNELPKLTPECTSRHLTAAMRLWRERLTRRPVQ